MRSLVVVVLAPHVRQRQRFPHAGEYLPGQEAITKTAMARLCVGVLPGRPGVTYSVSTGPARCRFRIARAMNPGPLSLQMQAEEPSHMNCSRGMATAPAA